jgi:hypothetical protein
METRVPWLRIPAIFVVLGFGALNNGFGQISTTMHTGPQGEPTWEPKDVHMFSVAMGTKKQIVPNLQAILESVFGKPKHVFLDRGWIYPGVRHLEGYPTEITSGLAAAGYPDHPPAWTFTAQDCKYPQGGVLFLFVTMPRTVAPSGTSPDSDVYGPIIPRAIKLTGQNTLYQNGVQILQYPWTPFPSLDDDPSYAKFDGSSHIPWTSGLWGLGPGSYELHHVLREDPDNGKGWEIVYRFKVVVPAQGQ